MSKSFSIGKAPSVYNPGEMARIMNRVERAMNSLGAGLGSLESSVSRVTREVTQRQKTEKVHLLTPIATIEWSEYDDGAGAIYAQAVFHFTQGWGRITTAQYRSASLTDGGNIPSTQAWTDISDMGSLLSFIADNAYPGGGYYRLRILMPHIKMSDKNTIVAVQVQALDVDDAVWFMSGSTFDPDKDPEVDFLNLSVGNWDEGTGKWTLYASGNADLDTESVAFAVDSAADLAADASLEGDDAAFNTGTTNLATSDKRFLVSLGVFDPSDVSEVTVYVVAKAWTEINKGGTGQSLPYKRAQVRIPRDPFDSGLIDDGELTANMLETASQRATIRLNGQHKSGFEHSTIQYNGYIQYGDTTTYNMAVDGTSFTDIEPDDEDELYYVFFDPGGWYGDGSGTPTIALQITKDESIAKAITGRRLLVGHVRTAASPERAFYVLTGDQVVITAPFIYASRLSALSANMGTLTSGEAIITNGSNSIWLNPAATGVFAIGPTTGGYAAAPFRVAADGTTTVTSLVATGYGQIQRQAAAPTTRGDTTALVSGDVWIDTDDGDRVWTWNSSAWSESLTKISGNNIVTGAIQSVSWGVGAGSKFDLDAETLYLGGSGAPKFSWNGAALAITGTVTATAGAIGGWTIDSNAIYIGTEVADDTYTAVGHLTLGAGFLGANQFKIAASGVATFKGALDAASGTFAGKISAGGIEIGSSLTGGGDGIRLDANNYWRDTGVMRVGDGTAYMDYASGVLTIVTAAGTVFDSTTSVFSNASLETLTISGTLTLGASGVIQTASYPTTGLLLNKDKIEVYNGLAGTSYVKTTIDSSLGYMQIVSGSPATSTLTLTGGTVNIFDGSDNITLSQTQLTSTGTSFAVSGATTTIAATTLLRFGLASSVFLSMPTGHGTNGQYLVTNGTGTMTWASPAGGGDALVANPLSQFAATSSAQLSGVISDETGSGLLVFGTAPTFVSIANTGIISAGTWQGTAVAVLYGGTGATTASAARTGLGLAIGTDVQAYSAALGYLSTVGGPSAIDKVLVSSAANTWAYRDALYVNASQYINGKNLTTIGTAGSLYGYIYIDINDGTVKKIPIYDV